MSTTESRIEVRTDRRSVLPWRRHHSVDVEVAPLVQLYAERHRRTDTAMIETAFEFGAHRPRRTGSAFG